MKKERKKFKDTRAFGILKGILPSAIDAIGISVPIPGLSAVTNIINRQIDKDHVPVADPILTTELDNITEKGKKNWTKIILSSSIAAIVLNAVAAKYLGVEIPTQAILELLRALFA